MIRKNSTVLKKVWLSLLTMKATGKFDGYLTLFAKVKEKLTSNLEKKTYPSFIFCFPMFLFPILD